MDNGVVDTLRTTAVGVSGHFVSRWEYLPNFVSIAVGITTIVYLALQISLTIKELKSNGTKKKKRKKGNSNPR